MSQSGGFGTHLFKTAQRTGLPVGYFCSTGNEVDVTVSELLRHLVELEDVRLLAAFSESIRRPDLLLEAARRAHELGKPVLFMKAGRTEAGSRAALSHTASLAGSDQVVDAVFEAYGVLRPRRMHELLDWARALAAPRRSGGGRLAIVTMSGGAGIALADAASEMGLEVPEFTGAEREELETIIPPFGSATNPVDCTGQVVNDLSGLGQVISVAARSPAVDMVCVAGLPDELTDEWAEPLRVSLNSTPKPLLAWCPTDEVVVEIAALGIPGFTDPAGATGAAAALARLAAFPGPPPTVDIDRGRQSRARDLLGEFSGRPFLLEPDAKKLLALYGVEPPPEGVARSPQEAATLASEVGFPIALKALSYKLPHKSDAGGVVLDLRRESEVLAAAGRMARQFSELDGFLIQQMAPAGIEMAIGLRRDPDFGPMLSVGLGGRLVELLDEVALLPAPCNEGTALAALRRLAHGRLVGARRGLTPAHAAAVARLLSSLGQAGVELPEVQEIDVNPLIAGSAGVLAVDALVVAG